MPRSRDLFRGSYDGVPPKLAALRVLAVVAAVFLLVLLLFLGGEYVQRYSAYQRVRSDEPNLPPFDAVDPLRAIAINSLLEVPRPRAEEALIRSGLPVYDLRIAPKDLRELQRTAEIVTARAVSTGIVREYVPARFRIGEEWVPIDVKLRGLTSLHYFKRRPSLRLKFPRQRLFHGKKQINISDPYDKGLTVDVTTNWELRRHGILTWESQFVVLRVNDEVVGLFQEIEQFGRSMADRNGRSEGFIFSGDGQFFGSEGPGYDKALAAIERVRACGATGVSTPAEHCEWAFVRDYFDVDRWAWAGAMIVVLNSAHGWHPDNLRLFWDPARGKFEPIPWDYAHFAFDPAKDVEGEPHFHGYGLFFNGIPEYRRMRDVRMWSLLTERIEPMIEHADKLFEELSEALRFDIRHPDFDVDRARQQLYGRTLRGNREYLMELFQRHDLRGRAWRDSAVAATIELENRGKAHLAVTAVEVDDGGRLRAVPLAEPAIVDGVWQGAPGRVHLSVTVPEGARVVGLSTRNEVTGQTLETDEIQLGPGQGAAPVIPVEREPEPLEFGARNVRAEKNRVVFGPGPVRLDRTVVIPRSHTVVFAPGLELRMGAGVSLVAFGDLTSVGSKSEPIRIFGAAPATPWGGVFVQGTRTHPRRVHVQHTIFEGGRGDQTQRTHFTGSFSVHDGVVTIGDSEFRDAEADDGINLKYCQVDLDGNLLLGSADDALDCDFCTGRVADNRVMKSGGDGLDFSGADLLVERNVVDGCGDKGFSVGENSQVTLRDNEVRNCPTGIAVKDLSEAHLVDNRVSRAEVGLALYVKKPTFGPSRAQVENLHLEQVATDFVRDENCVLEIEGRDAG